MPKKIISLALAFIISVTCLTFPNINKMLPKKMGSSPAYAFEIWDICNKKWSYNKTISYLKKQGAYYTSKKRKDGSHQMVIPTFFSLSGDKDNGKFVKNNKGILYIKSGKSIKVCGYTGKSKTVTIPKIISNKIVSKLSLTCYNSYDFDKQGKCLGGGCGGAIFNKSCKVLTLKIPNTIKSIDFDGGIRYRLSKKSPMAKEFLKNIEWLYFDFTDGTKPVTKLYAKDITKTSTKLSWNKTTGAKGYDIYKYNYKTKKYSKIKTTSSTSYTVKKLSAGTKYKFAIKAYKHIKGKKFCSTKYTTKEIVTAISTVSGLKAKTYSNSSKLSWNKISGASGYEVYIYNYSKKSYKKVGTTKGTSYTFNDLNDGQKYTLAVRAYKNIGSKKAFSQGYATTKVETMAINRKI